ncbi:uncharacterized protein MELLADRAFT_89675 [Melampsora larici-populina 98AG31]|uniref:BTB domain-containing protein n=1 Tax=Melampsora larici-populina (strain 98AG31 / pathotype 3-4-7) TaxID=747676 RepID=F4RU72_MELLP|nr:uncharacterized protein MELLADRAFT_89675 [Melampsora larici-populina 98AG31]EGG04127.1 hypothetical protein MELLADRAFT_89675 [Melampsora larici-populina 98AG31]
MRNDLLEGPSSLIHSPSLDLDDTPSGTSTRSYAEASRQKNGPYTIIVRGKTFILTRDQIQFDSPNLFTIAFLDDIYSENVSGRLRLDSRSPDLFEIIVEYLSGYPILPVKEPAKLLADSKYYGLDGLRDLLSLPIVGPSLSSRHSIRKVVRLEDMVSGRTNDIEWTKDGLVEVARGPPSHVMVFITGASFRLDMTVTLNGECVQALFGIELPPYAEDTHEWTTMMAESLSATPVVLNDGAFDGNFGDLVNWVASFLERFSPPRDKLTAANYERGIRPVPLQEPDITESLTRIMPGLAGNLRLEASQGHTALKLTTSFWATELSVIVTPMFTDSSQVENPPKLVAKLLNCSLTTGLFRRRALRPIVQRSDEDQ